MRILEVTPENIDQAWPHALPWIEKANIRGNSRYPAQDIRDDIMYGKKRLAKLINGNDFAWLVYGVVENSKGRTCILYCIAGEGMLNFIGKIDEFARAYAIVNGCDYITCSGRVGWTKELKSVGWSEISRTYGKEV